MPDLKKVYINCPFDPEYQPLKEAIIFTFVCCGMMPINPSGSSAGLRIDRILEHCKEADYSFHDLSRCYGEGKDNTARFNMPIELGVWLGCKGKESLIFLFPNTDSSESSKHKVGDVASNLLGFDPPCHDGTEKSIIDQVMDAVETGYNQTIEETFFTRDSIFKHLEKYRDQLKGLANERYKGQRQSIPWSKLVKEAAVLVGHIRSGA